MHGSLQSTGLDGFICLNKKKKLACLDRLVVWIELVLQAACCKFQRLCWWLTKSPESCYSPGDKICSEYFGCMSTNFNSSTPWTLWLQEVSTRLDWSSIWLKISYFIVRRHIDMHVISCNLWGIWLFQPVQPKCQGSHFTSGFSWASREVRSPSCHRTHV